MRLLSVPSTLIASNKHSLGRRLRTRRSRERALRLIMMLGSCGILGSWSQGQGRFDSGKWELMRNQQEHAHFTQAQKDAEQGRNLERARIPGYNLELSQETQAFQKHISDMHQRQVSCKLCREHVKRIRNLSRKIEQGMK
jgi:hypothetical protein